VYDEIKNQAELFTTSMGVHTLKNVTKPMKVYTVFNHELGNIERSTAKVVEDSGDRSFIKWIIGALAIISLAIFTYTSDFFNRESAHDSIAEIADKSIAVFA